MKANNNNWYDDEFKTSAVKMVAEKGRTISAVAKDLGISELALRRWVRASTEPEDATSKKLTEFEAENKRFRKGLDDAKDTVTVLKKSAAIFVRP